jgi:hypothetical protein
VDACSLFADKANESPAETPTKDESPLTRPESKKELYAKQELQVKQLLAQSLAAIAESSKLATAAALPKPRLEDAFKSVAEWCDKIQLKPEQKAKIMARYSTPLAIAAADPLKLSNELDATAIECWIYMRKDYH